MRCCNNTYKKMYIQDQAINPPGPPTPELGYGLLYNWYAATDVRGVAPSGFRVPSKSDVDTLYISLGGASVSGGKLKSTRDVTDGEPYWDSPNVGATNESQMSFLPSGIRSGLNGTYSSIKESCRLWTTTNLVATIGWNPVTFRSLESASFLNEQYRLGCSVRCISDTEPVTPTVQDQDENDYTWVQIGSQYWLVQNLRTTSYNNGDPIPTGLSNAAWAATTDGAYALPNGDPSLPI